MHIDPPKPSNGTWEIKPFADEDIFANNNDAKYE